MANETQKVTPSEQAMGFSIAAIVLATTVLDAAVGRGDITADGARGVILRAREFLRKQPPGVPNEAVVF
jgi:hypothetical protein